MKKAFVFTFFFSWFCTTYAQHLSLIKQISGTGHDNPQHIKKDADGNIYVIGNFDGTTDFNPGTATFDLSTSGNNDIFILKLDSLGDFVWARKIGSLDYDNCHEFDFDINGNIYLSGEFNATVDFDPGAGVYNMTATGYEDIFICKLNSDGIFQWAKQISGTMAVGYSYALDIDNAQNILITGGFWGTVDFDPGPGISNMISDPVDIDVFVGKYDTLGNLIWRKQMIGTSLEAGLSIKSDISNNIFLAGTFGSNFDADPGPGILTYNSLGSDDIFITKLNSSGDLIWTKQFGSAGNEAARDITLDDSSNLFITGNFENSIDFDDGIATYSFTSNGQSDIVILKIDSSGSLIWGKQIGGNSNDYGISVTVDHNGHSYFACYFRDTVDVDPGPSIMNLISSDGPSVDNLFLLRLLPNGEFSWAYHFGTTGGQRISSMCTDHLNRLYLTGHFSDSVDFDPGPISNTLTSTGLFMDGFVSIWSGDVCAYLNTEVIVSGNELTSSMPAVSYQWIDCNTNLAILSDTNQTYIANSDGSYAVVVNYTSCIDTSDCFVIIGTEIEEPSNSFDTKIFPNPCNDIIHISTKKGFGGTTILLRNSIGTIVRERKNVFGESFHFDMTLMPKGVYLIELIEGLQVKKIKLVKV